MEFVACGESVATLEQLAKDNWKTFDWYEPFWNDPYPYYDLFYEAEIYDPSPWWRTLQPVRFSFFDDDEYDSDEGMWREIDRLNDIEGFDDFDDFDDFDYPAPAPKDKQLVSARTTGNWIIDNDDFWP
jgi:hypothetical protein